MVATENRQPELSRVGAHVSAILPGHLEEITALLMSESCGLDHGILRLEVFVRDSRVQRYAVHREISILAGDHDDNG